MDWSSGRFIEDMCFEIVLIGEMHSSDFNQLIVMHFPMQYYITATIFTLYHTLKDCY